MTNQFDIHRLRRTAMLHEELPLKQSWRFHDEDDCFQVEPATAQMIWRFVQSHLSWETIAIATTLLHDVGSCRRQRPNSILWRLVRP